MNNSKSETSDRQGSTIIRDLNDKFRRTFAGGAVMLTAGIVALGNEKQRAILAAVQAFDGFDAGNDPYGEHDFGCMEVVGERVFFKIDYYDLERCMHSPDAADPSATERVLTIMLASEY